MTEYGSLREKIAAEKVEKVERQENFKTLILRAREAGLAAGNNFDPNPMIVTSHENHGRALLTPNDPGPIANQWFVADGVCGFAWVVFSVNNDAAAEEKTLGRQFVNWLTGNQKPSRPDLAPSVKADKHYHGGHSIWIGDHNQSMQRKEAHAQAFAESLRPYFPGLSIHAGSRMD